MNVVGNGFKPFGPVIGGIESSHGGKQGLGGADI